MGNLQKEVILDAEEALHALLSAMQSHHDAVGRVRAQEYENEERRKDWSGYQSSEAAAEAGRKKVAKLTEEVDAARDRRDVTMAIYQEAARARDAKAADTRAAAMVTAADAQAKAAVAANRYADAVRWATTWIMIAGIVQALLAGIALMRGYLAGG